MLSLVIYTLVPMKALRKSLAAVRCSKIPRSSPKPRKQAVKVNGEEVCIAVEKALESDKLGSNSASATYQQGDLGPTTALTLK